MSRRTYVHRAMLAALLVLGFSSGTASAEGTALRPLADAANFHFGVAVDVDALGDPSHVQLLADNVNTLSTRSDLSFGIVQPQQGIFDFSRADAIVDVAVAHDMTVRGHDLIGSEPLPDWIVNGTWSTDTLGQVLHDHVTAVVSHFAERNPGVITQWDVVAETVLPDGSPRPSIWHQVIGDDYMRIAYDAARAADPTAQLFYDDFFDDLSVTQDAVANGVPIVPGANAERSTCEAVAKCSAVRDRLSGLIAAGAPIDGVGFQAHLFSPDPADFSSLTTWVGDLDLVWAITEFDVPLPITEIANPDSLEFQAATYAAAVRACAAAVNCNTMITWGATDRLSPIDEATGGAFGGALWIDADNRPKPAFEAIARVLGEFGAPTPTAPSTTITPSTAPSTAAPVVSDQGGSSNDWVIAPAGAGVIVLAAAAVALARRRPTRSGHPIADREGDTADRSVSRSAVRRWRGGSGSSTRRARPAHRR